MSQKSRKRTYEICQLQGRFNSILFRNNLPVIKDGAYA